MSDEREESDLPAVDDGFRRFCTSCGTWSAEVYRCTVDSCAVELADSQPTKRVPIAEQGML